MGTMLSQPQLQKLLVLHLPGGQQYNQARWEALLPSGDRLKNHYVREYSSSYKSYLAARKGAEKDFDRTCGMCNKVFDGYNRKRHETSVHEDSGKFECD